LKAEIEQIEVTKSDVGGEANRIVIPTGTPSGNAHLTSSRLLARNTLWNMGGSAAPMFVAAICIPLLIKGLGTDRFGVLTLVWALIGYATLFDLGLGRALTQLVATKLGTGEDHEIPTLVWTSLLLMLLLGVLGAVVMILLAPWLVNHTLHVAGGLGHETLYSLYLLALSIPVVISTAALRGLLEAHQRFGLTTALRVPMGVFAYAGPLLVLPFSKSLFPVVAVLVAGRLIAWAAHLLLCLRVMPMLRHRIVWRRAAMGPLLRFGSWMTVSNIVSPLMVTLDRFVIGSLLSVGAVAYYATPYEVVTKFWLIPGSLIGVLFPAFSTSFAQDRNRTALLYGRSVKLLLLTMFPLILVVVALASDGLKLWLGAEFAKHSTPVLQWLAVGMFVNCLAWAPLGAIQGAGRPDLTAKLHMFELPLYLIALFWLTKTYGIEGAAMAWTARVSLDAAALFIVAQRFLPVRPSVQLQTLLLFAGALGTLALSTLPHTLEMKVVLLAFIFIGFVVTGWFLVLSRQERKLVERFSSMIITHKVG
jgi:O-antigen/teichoic acid export membrane protein